MEGKDKKAPSGTLGGSPHAAPPPAASGPTAAQQQQMDEMGPEEARAALGQLTGLFFNGTPKHALSGVGEGLANVATGVSMGLVGLVGGTVAGSTEDGVWGGVKGFGAGLVGLAGLTGYGAFTGLRQVGRGLYNTPEAVTQASKGELLWDSTQGRWVKVLLEAEWQELPTTDDDIKAKARQLYREAAAEEGEKVKETGKVPTSPASALASPEAADGATAAAARYPGMNERGEVTDYYLFLGISRTATSGEIRKAFTRKALEMHPDKNPNDPNATARFQQLLQVHNVLSDEVTRAEYDRTGHVDASKVQDAEVNPIAEALGVAFLEPLVGKLRFVRYFESSTLYDSDMLKELHRRRRLRIAQNLCRYLDNAETGFDAASFVLRDAVASRAGPQIVTFIAESYHTAARQHLHGSGWKRELDSWYSSKAAYLSTSLGLAASGARTTFKAVRGKATEEDMLALLVAANEADIRRTVLQACRLALYDASVSAEARTQRARRLEQLSDVAMEEVRKELASRRTEADVVMGEVLPASEDAKAKTPDK